MAEEPYPVIRGVIFDMDGTLADTLPVCLEAFRRAAEPLSGKLYTDAEIAATFGPSEEGAVGVLAPGRAEECLQAYLKHYAELHEGCAAPFEGVLELLNDLQGRGVRLGLVTGKGAGSADISLARLQLTPFFSHVETGSPTGPRKVEAMQIILEDWGMAPETAAYVGDVAQDMRDARRVGVAALAAGWAATADRAALQTTEPDVLMTSLADLRDWLEPRLDGQM